MDLSLLHTGLFQEKQIRDFGGLRIVHNLYIAYCQLLIDSLPGPLCPRFYCKVPTFPFRSTGFASRYF